MRNCLKAILIGVTLWLLTLTTFGKRPEPPSENYLISGDVVSVVIDVDESGNIIAISNGVEITMGSQVELWLSESILAIDYALLENHVSGTEPLWPSGDVPPLWIEGELPLAFAPSEWLEPEWNEDLQRWGRYYFGEVRLIKGEDDSRFDFDFSPHGPCTNPWGKTLPVNADPSVWEEWRLYGEEDSPPVCPFGLLLLGGKEDPITGNVTFEATSELFLVRKGGYPRVLLYDFTLGPLCPETSQKPGNRKEEPPVTIPPEGCIRDTGGYTVGTGPVADPIIFSPSED